MPKAEAAGGYSRLLEIRYSPKIQGDSKWKNVTHLGEEYAALLVDPSYSPRKLRNCCRPQAARSAAVALVQGRTADSSPPKMLHFSGYDWLVRDLLSFRAGSLNSFDPANAWTDENGALHLRITKNRTDGVAAEVQLTRSLDTSPAISSVRDIPSRKS